MNGNSIETPVPVKVDPVRPRKYNAPDLISRRTAPQPSTDPDNQDENSESDDLEVVETEENVKYQENMTVGVLSRLGSRKTLWESKIGSFFVIMSFVMSYEIIATMTFKLGEFGVRFFIMYSSCVILMGFPLMYLEMALGQYCSTNVLFVFTRMAPAFGGIGILALFHNLCYLVLDQRTSTFLAKFFFDAVNIFSSDHAWQNCNGASNNKYCKTDKDKCKDIYVQESTAGTAYEQYFSRDGIPLGEHCVPSESLRILNIDNLGYTSIMDVLVQTSKFDYIMYNFDSETAAQHGYITHLSILYLTIILMIISIAVKHSSKLLVKMSVFVQLLVYALVITVIYIALFRYPPEFPYMYAFQGNHQPPPGESSSHWYWRMFVEAFLLALNACKVGQGGLFYLGSQNHFHNNFIWDSVVLALLMIVLPLLYSCLHMLTIDSFFFKLVKGDEKSYEVMTGLATENSKLYRSGNELVFMALLVTSLQVYKEYEPVIMCIFSLLWFLNSICNKAIRCEIIVSTIMEMFPTTNSEENRTLVINAVVYLTGLTVMIFFSTYGFDINNDWQHDLIPISVILCVLLQLIVIGLCYGPSRLFANVTFMLSGANDNNRSILTQLLNSGLMILWFIVIPICAASVLTYKMIVFPLFVPYWYINILFLLFTWLIVPLYLMNQIVKQRSGNSSLCRLFKPVVELWGPRNTSSRKTAEVIEKQMRGI